MARIFLTLENATSCTIDTAILIHVLFTIDNIIQDSLGGGFLRQLRYSSYLSDHGVRFEWFTTESDADQSFEDRWATRIHVVKTANDLTHYEKRDLLMEKAIEYAAQFPTGTCLICTSTSGMTWRMTAMLLHARIKGIACLYNSTIMPGPLPVTWQGKLKLIILHAAFFKSHTMLIFQTRRLADFYRRYFYIAASKIEVISNGVDCTRYLPVEPDQKLAVRERLNLPAEGPVVLMVGGVVPRKGVQLLLAAWPEVLRQYPRAKLVVAGTVGRRATFVDHAVDLDVFTEEILSQIQKLPAPSSVVLSGKHVDHVLDYYQAADVFAFASELEGLPNAVLEAMACGLPSVVVPYEGFPADGEELGRAGTHFLKCARDPSTIADGLLRLMGDPALCREMGLAARELMLATQDMSHTIDRWAAACRRVAASAFFP